MRSSGRSSMGTWPAPGITLSWQRGIAGQLGGPRRGHEHVPRAPQEQRGDEDPGELPGVLGHQELASGAQQRQRRARGDVGGHRDRGGER